MASFEDFVSCVLAQLTPEEQAGAVVYAAATDTPIAAGTKLVFPATVLDVPSASRLAFIDRQPMANWGHAARYLLIEDARGTVLSIETRLPPFAPGNHLRWRVVYRGPSVPDAGVVQQE